MSGEGDNSAVAHLYLPKDVNTIFAVCAKALGRMVRSGKEEILMRCKGDDKKAGKDTLALRVGHAISEEIQRTFIAGPLSQLNAAMATIVAVGNQSAQAINMGSDALSRVAHVCDRAENLNEDVKDERLEVDALMGEVREMINRLDRVLAKSAPSKKTKAKK